MLSVSPAHAHRVGGNSAAAVKPRVFFGGRDGNIKVMSWNCRKFHRDLLSGEMLKTDAKIALLGKVISAENPDILCLQEAGDEALMSAFNRARLGGRYAHVISTGAAGENGGQVAILAKPGLTPVKKTIHKLGFTHPLLEVTFADEQGREVTVFNAHFKAPHPNVWDTYGKRLNEARMAANIIRQRLGENPEMDIILAGDLNAAYDKPTGRPISQALAGLPVAMKEPLTPEAVQGGMLVEPFLAKRESLPDRLLDTYRQRSQRGKNDYFWVTPGVYERLKSTRVVGSLRNRTFRRISDHLPITMVYEPKPAAVTFGTRLDRIA